MRSARFVGIVGRNEPEVSVVMAVIGLVLAGVVGATGHSAATTRPAAPAGYKLVWDEEFDKDGPVDTAKWAYETGMIRNHEAQTYTDARKENARVEDGHLVIEGRHEKMAVPGRKGGQEHSADYTSASIYSKASWKYGRVEVRAKVPVGRGTWPAIWFLGDNILHGGGWPRCGEIDLMETVGFDPTRVHQSIHTEAYNWVKHTQKTAVTPVKDLADAFHVYAVEWTPEKVDMFIDGQRKFTFANEHKGVAEWPFDQPIHLKLNLAIGGDWGGQKGIDDKAFPQRYLVDYVRVYQKE